MPPPMPLRPTAEIGPDFDKLAQRALAVAEQAERFGQPTAADHVRWIDLSPQQARLVESPLDIRDMLSEQRRAGRQDLDLHLGHAGRRRTPELVHARPPGLEDAVTLRVGSPFDYRAHARLWVPTPFPKPNDPAHPAAVGALAARCAQALGGRCFVLTTTLRVLPLIADAMRRALELEGQVTWSCWCRAASPSARCCSASATAEAACCWVRRASGKASTCPAMRCSAC